jgi:hypothetical protein
MFLCLNGTSDTHLSLRCLGQTGSYDVVSDIGQALACHVINTRF